MLDIITQRLTVADFLKDVEPKYPEWGTDLRTAIPDGLEDMPFIRKGFELSPDDLEFPPGAEREEVATISTLALDRDQEVLLPEGADLRFYKKNPIVPYAHDYWALPVGTSLWVKIDSKESPTALIARTRYSSKEANPIGYQVFLLHKEGILTAKSVGFIPMKWIDQSDDNYVDAVNEWRARREAQGIRKEGDPRRIYTKWMLLEYSPVAVPSNPEAVSMAISKGVLTLEDAEARGLIEPDEEIDEVTPNTDEVNQPSRLHPDDLALIVDAISAIGEKPEPVDDEPEPIDENIIEIEDPAEEVNNEDIDIDPEAIRAMVAEILGKPDDIETEPSPDIKLRLERGEIFPVEVSG